VFVTGTSTGIGAATVIHLCKQGFRVFAGVRQAVDGEALMSRTSGELHPVVIDITDDETILAAVKTVSEAVGERGLAGLVNNAGIVKPGPIEFQPMADFRRQVEVNLFGQVAVTQAFLPLIRRGGGRIVNVGSIGGRVALPLHGAYSASKFAMEGLTDALRLELRQWNIHVALVDPGSTDTAIFGKTLAEFDRMPTTLGEYGHKLYQEQIDGVRKLVEKTAADTADPVVIARAVAHALTSDKPKTRYLAGKGAKELAAMARTLPDHLRDRAVAREASLPDPE
jgi:NAD(P)-dependent dehydrogenase (short-subunit alcohol dehydrogenase family)